MSNISIPTLRQLVSHAAEAWELVREAFSTAKDEIGTLQDDVATLQGDVVSPATADVAGTMPAGAYRLYSGTPTTDPTAAISTAGSSGTYHEGTGTCASTLDGITLSFDYCFDIGHGADKELVVGVECPGFGGQKSSITTTQRHRHASYTQGGRAWLVVASGTRGRPAVGQIDECRDTYDMLDIARAAAVLAEGFGATVFEHGDVFIPIGYSTGAVAVVNAIARLTNHVAAGIVIYPNWSLRQYWQLSAGSRSAMTSMVGNLGTSTPAQVDPYEVREGATRLGDVIGLTGFLGLWIGADRTEAPTVPITDPDPLVPLAGSSLAAASKVHPIITQTGSAFRVLHGQGSGDTGPDSTGVIEFEKRCFGVVLEQIAAWSMPVAGKVRVNGWIKFRGKTGAANPKDNRYALEVFTDTSAANCKAASTGGLNHVLDMEYDAQGRFQFTPLTSTNGKYQILSRANDRRGSFTAGTPFSEDLNAAPSIAASTAGIKVLDPKHLYSTADAGTITGTTTVTAWADQPRSGVTGVNFAASGGNEPATVTDGDSVLAIEFTAANSDRMTVAQLVADPRSDFTLIGVISKLDTATPQHFFEMSSTVGGKSARINVSYNSGVDAADFFDDSNVRAIANSNGLGGHTFSASNAKHFYVLMRRTELDGLTYLYESFDGLVWSRSQITGTTFTFSSAITVIGAGYAPGAGATYRWFGGRYYALVSFDRAMSWAEIEAVRGSAKTQFTF